MTKPFRECDYFTCARCGRRITRGGSRRASLACRDCQMADPYGTAAILGNDTPDTEPTIQRRARRVPDDRLTWTEPDLRAAHAAYRRGERDDWTVAGAREYNRRHRATSRPSRANKDAA
jgi:hypothetical protein